jgi:hypothetical protein
MCFTGCTIAVAVAGRSALRRVVAPGLVVGGLSLAASTAGAIPLDPTSAQLPGGSTFQGGDGDQTPAPALTDWATPDVVEQVARKSDPNAQDTTLDGANNEPGLWDIVLSTGGVTPSGSNIQEAWTVIDEVGASTFTYLSFYRAGDTGSSYLAYELNRDGQSWNNGRAHIPCRRDGDLLITFEPSGNVVNVTVKTWQTGVADDPGTGCARTGSASDVTGLVANEDVQAALNLSAIPNSLPGVGANIAARQFGETALNLGTVLEGAVDSPCGTFTSVWMNSRSSVSVTSSLKDYVSPHEIDARRCSAAGTKWHDSDADGVRDEGEIGLAGWRIYVDLNADDTYDLGEPFAITDEHGDYIIDDIRETGEYTLREAPTDAALDGPWTCSHPSPCEHTVDAAAEPYARDRDFGNWRPARVTLSKQLDPPDDPGQFNLSVGTQTLENAGDGDSRTFEVEPGTHTVAETPAGETNADDYDSEVECHEPAGPPGTFSGVTSTTITALSGQRFVCEFVNVRRGVPSIDIDKEAPEFALHGDTLRYRLHVRNTGTVPFDAEDVEVTDDDCDNPPRLRRTLDANGEPDATPETLHPDDTWIYVCRRTIEPLDDPDDCEPRTATNTAHVAVPDAEDESTGETELICPPPREPGVAIQKIGPETSVAGTPLPYVLWVTNIGEVPFAEADVTVSDPACDEEPELVARFDASGEPDTESPERLDPHDWWVYRCVSTTPAPSANCQPSEVRNTSTVVARSERRTVEHSDSFVTPLTCPPGPPSPPPPTPQPPPPVPGTPPGIDPDRRPGIVLAAAGVAGRANFRPPRRCLRRGSRLVVRGRRIASVTVTVGGRRVGRRRVGALQRRAVIRVARNLRPGRRRATAVVRFHRGSATPTVRLVRRVRVCAVGAQQPPRFTG